MTVMTRAALQALADLITNETAKRANTTERVGGAIRALADSAVISQAEGPVFGPVSSADGNLLVFDDTTGQAVRDAGIDLADIGQSFNVRLFGASPAAAAAVNTAAFQDAIDDATAAYVATGAIQTVVVPPGTYKLQPSATSSWDMPLLGSTTEVHIAVMLKSGVMLDCTGATFVAVPPAGADTAWYYALFGTDLNMTVGDVERVGFLGGNIDFTDDHWDATLFTIYGLLIVGASDLNIDRTACRCTGTTRIGRLARVMNSENVRITNWEGDFISQGLYLNYVNGLKMSGTITRFSEGIDIDSPCQNVECSLIAKGAADGDRQCLDITSVVNGYFFLECDDVGEAAIIYQKPDSYPTFALWCSDLVTDTAAADPVFCDNVTLDVLGTNIHGTNSRSVLVSLNREDPPAAHPNYWDTKGNLKRITVRAQLKDCDPILVYECDGLDLIADLEDVTCGTSNRLNNAAVLLRQARTGATLIAASKLSGRAIVRVKNSDKTGVRVIGPTDFHLEATVDGYNSSDDATSGVASGVYIEGLGLKDGACTIANIRCDNGDPTVTPVDLRFGWDGAGGSIAVNDLGGHRLSSGGTTPVNGGSVQAKFSGSTGESRQTSIDSTAGGNTVILGVIRGTAGMAVQASVVAEAAITGNATNYSNLSLRRVRAGVLSSAIGTAILYDNVNRAAGSVVDLGVTGDTDGVFQDGDLVAVQVGQVGTGSDIGAVTALWFRWKLVEYAL
jgi:hypothetical protein